MSPFQEALRALLLQIPCGRVVSYKEMARVLDCASSRAVGQALRANTQAPLVPCHRVISSNLHLGGYSGARSGPEIERKIQLLAAEGVLFDAQGRLVEKERLWNFP